MLKSKFTERISRVQINHSSLNSLYDLQTYQNDCTDLRFDTLENTYSTRVNDVELVANGSFKNYVLSFLEKLNRHIFADLGELLRAFELAKEFVFLIKLERIAKDSLQPDL